MKDEKYIDKEFVENLVNMFDSKSDGDVNLAAQIFANILDDEKDIKEFMDGFDELINENKTKIVESSPTPNKEYKVNKDYLKLCLEHTACRMKQEKYKLDE